MPLNHPLSRVAFPGSQREAEDRCLDGASGYSLTDLPTRFPPAHPPPRGWEVDPEREPLVLPACGAEILELPPQNPFTPSPVLWLCFIFFVFKYTMFSSSFRFTKKLRI